MSEKFCISEDVFANVSQFRGKPRIDLRKWYETKEGELAPGKNGLNVDVETWNDIVSKWEEIKEFVEKELKK
jgi:Transcriptional Coactivator p15 (PC4)